MPSDQKYLPFLIIIGIVCIGIGLYSVLRSPDTAPGTSTTTGGQSITVDASQMWTNTGIQIKQGDRFTINASGQVNIGSPGDGADKWVGPDGWGHIPQFMSSTGQPHRYVYAVNNSAGSLIGKIGNSRPFQVGSSYNGTSQNNGTLYLGANDVISDPNGRILDEASATSMTFANNRGSFNVQVQVR